MYIVQSKYSAIGIKFSAIKNHTFGKYTISPIKRPTSEGKHVIKAQLYSRHFILWEAAFIFQH